MRDLLTFTSAPNSHDPATESERYGGHAFVSAPRVGLSVCTLIMIMGIVTTTTRSTAVELTVSDISVSGGLIYGNAVILPVGETVEIGARVEAPGATAWYGVGVSYFGYDGELIDFVDGISVAHIFGQVCFDGFAFGGLDNLLSSTSGTQAVLSETNVFDGVPLSGTPRVRGLVALNAGGTANAPAAGDVGLNGVCAGGDAHMRVTFEGLSDGYTQIEIGTGDDLGGVLVEALGVLSQANNAQVRIAVPEPGLAWSLFAGGLGLVVARRRTPRRPTYPVLTDDVESI